MSQGVMWRFGKDETCLARIHPGNANTQTPSVLQFGGDLVLKKAPDGNRHPDSGWFRVTRSQYQVLAQVTDPVSSLPVISFRANPTTEHALAVRRAQQRTRVQNLLGFDQEALKAQVREEILQEIKEDLKKSLEEESEGDSSPDESSSSEAEVVSPSEEESQSASDGLEIPEEVSEEVEPVELPEPPKKSRRLRSSKKK